MISHLYDSSLHSNLINIPVVYVVIRAQVLIGGVMHLRNVPGRSVCAHVGPPMSAHP